jgi:VPDSG-CTERM motif
VEQWINSIKKIMKKIFLVALLFGSLSFAHATSVGAPGGMIGTGALNGTYAYLWSVPVAGPQNVTAASITFTAITETHGGNGNDISVDFGSFVGIGTVPTSGNFTKITDNDASGDAFQPNVTAGKAVHLGTRLFPSLNVSQTWTYIFSGAQLMALNTYIAAGNWGFEIDPDCTFDVGGIKFDYTSQTTTNHVSVPDSMTTFGLLGISLLGLLAIRRKLCTN